MALGHLGGGRELVQRVEEIAAQHDVRLDTIAVALAQPVLHALALAHVEVPHHFLQASHEVLSEMRADKLLQLIDQRTTGRAKVIAVCFCVGDRLINATLVFIVTAARLKALVERMQQEELDRRLNVEVRSRRRLSLHHCRVIVKSQAEEKLELSDRLVGRRDDLLAQRKALDAEEQVEARPVLE